MSRPALEAALATERATVATLEAALAAGEAPDELLDMEQSLARFGAGRDALLAAARRDELELSRGPRNKLLVSRVALEAWLRSRPHRPTQLAPQATVTSLADWEAEADRALGSSH